MTASLNCQKPAQWRYAIGTPNTYEAPARQGVKETRRER